MAKPSSAKPQEPPQLETPRAVDFNLIDKARTLFEAAFATAEPSTTWRHGKRTFSIQDDLGLMLHGLHVPTCDSLHGLCRASDLIEFKQRYCCFARDLASISKAQAHVPEDVSFEPIAQCPLARAVTSATVVKK